MAQGGEDLKEHLCSTDKDEAVDREETLEEIR